MNEQELRTLAEIMDKNGWDNAWFERGKLWWHVTDEVGGQMKQCWHPDMGEEPQIINWALDELAKMEEWVSLRKDPNGGWFVSWYNPLLGNPQTKLHPTKTLALAHAIVEVARG